VPHAGTAEEAYRSDREAQHAFEAYDVFGDFVYIGGGKAPSKHVTVRNSHFDRKVAKHFGHEWRGSAVEQQFRSRPSGAATLQTDGSVHNFWLASKGASSDVR
jgi:hypothetical protein